MLPIAKLPLRALVPTAVPDPGVIRHGGLYTMLGTTNESKDTFHIYESKGRDGPWRRAKDAHGRALSIFPKGKMPAWISSMEPDRWAPEPHIFNGEAVCLYTARAKVDNRLKIAIAVAPKLRGDWVDLGPIADAPHGLIDSTMHRDRLSGQYVMAYKSDDNSVHEPTPILTRTFKLDGQKFEWTGAPHQIAISGEGHDGLLEAPAFCDANGTTYCVLSSGYFGDASYKMWIGQIDDIVGGEIKNLVPLMTSDSPCVKGRWKGPGHCSLVPESPGVFSIFFHAWPADAPDAAPFHMRFNANVEGRKPLRATLAFVDAQGKPCEPYIVEDRIQAGTLAPK